MFNFAYVRQGEPLGLGHAVLVTRDLVGDEPFAVILADDVIDADPPATKQLIDVFDRLDGPVLAVERVPRASISSYGVIDPDPSADLGEGIYRVRDLVEKPPVDEAPSDLAIIGRYILTPDIFPALAATKSDRTGEIQLTNGIRELLKSRPVYACEVKGVRHDTGNKLGFLKAVVYFALRRPDLADAFSEYLRSLDLAGARQAVTATSLSRPTAGAAADVDPLPELAALVRFAFPRVFRCSPVSAFSLVGFFALLALSALSLLSLFPPCRSSRSFGLTLVVPLRTCRPPSRAAVFLGVVSDVEAGPLELNRRRRLQFVYGGAALRALVQRRDLNTSESSRNGDRTRRTRTGTKAFLFRSFTRSDRPHRLCRASVGDGARAVQSRCRARCRETCAAKTPCPAAACSPAEA